MRVYYLFITVDFFLGDDSGALSGHRTAALEKTLRSPFELIFFGVLSGTFTEALEKKIVSSL